ncbi:hypothetical protein N0V93_002952 [Gnomoniopsis smithogilvyi]|uniref:Uncharacterized protein n=1 Tax=Gnomoniopsis smithogilvyi TaxID=1191159 RepID=A0A9W8YW81_9PEZI|nr:hypothetical protein N0V93_002952 [Gnomoniopsis smithogilvyi]
MQPGIQRRMTGFGQGNLISKWLNAYVEGDVNRPEDLDEWRTGPHGWLDNAPKPGPYLSYVKALVRNWPHLQLLVDFMDVGTTPVRWNPGIPGGLPEDKKARSSERDERMARTRVSFLEYPTDGAKPIAKEHFSDSGELDRHIESLKGKDASSVKLRLYVVEDLSREVIETLGSHYDVDPSFFREHLVDYVWYNIKDWWREAPNLDIVSRGQNWFQMRFSRSRYFKDRDAFKEGECKARRFNVYRQLQGDFNHSKFWDTNEEPNGKKKEAKVGSLRSRATFWMKQPEKKPTSDDTLAIHEPTIGILLLDPTIEVGNPLWMHYRNWNRVPSMHDKTPRGEEIGPGQRSFFDDFIYWATRPEAFSFNPEFHHLSPELHQHTEPSPVCVPTQALLHMVCTEWLTLVEYIKTRLNQVDWEIAFPQDFLAKDEQIERALFKLHYWRRVVPVYRAMLAETFLRVFREAKHPDRLHPSRGKNAHIALPERIPGDRSSIMTATGGGSGGLGAGGSSRGPASALDDLLNRDCINAYQQDFTLILNSMEEFQSRIDRLTEVVTAVISIQDSRRGYKDNKNLQWLTWLATFFIPLSFVATMLSMTTGPLDQLHDAAVMWAEVSIPSGLLIMSTVLLMSIAKCRRAIRAKAIEFPWVGKFRPFKGVRKKE